MPRDNTDKIPIDQIAILDGEDWRDWRRKDKARSAETINVNGEWYLAFEFEAVEWPEANDRSFAVLWIIRRSGEQWRSDLLWRLRWNAAEYVKDNEIGKREYRTLIPMSTPAMAGSGEEFGLVFGNAEQTVRSAIRKFRMPVWGEPQPPGDERGEPWPFFTDGRAPVLAMTPTGEQGRSVWQAWRTEAYSELVSMDVDGTHTPLDGRVTEDFAVVYRANSAVRTSTHPRGLVTAAWCVFEGQGEPADALAVVRELVSLYDSLDEPGGMIIGPTWDVWEASGWEDEGDVSQWVSDAKVIVGNRRIVIGARARRNPDTGRAEQVYDGDYVSYEAHVENGAAADAVFAGAVREADGRPVGEFDRFRVRNAGDDKDMTDEDMPLVCRASRRRRVAIIIGHNSDTGARPFALAEEIRTELLAGEPEPRPEPEPEPEPEPDCAAAVRVARAADAAALDAIEARLRKEMIEPWRALGFWGRIFQGEAAIQRGEAIIAEDYRPLVDDMRGSVP